MISLVLFFIDFCACFIFKGWFVRSLLVYFIYVLMKKDPYEASFKHLFLPIFLLLLQDCFLFGRFGLAFAYILPLVLFSMRMKHFLMATEEVIVYFLIVGAILFEAVLVKKILFSRPIFDYGFLFEIITNIIITRIILLGMRGNRFLPGIFNLKIFGRGRKVWTPSR